MRRITGEEDASSRKAFGGIGSGFHFMTFSIARGTSAPSDARSHLWQFSSDKLDQTSVFGRSGVPTELTARNPESNGFSMRKKPVNSELST